MKAGCATALVLNKWDLTVRRRLRPRPRARAGQPQAAPAPARAHRRRRRPAATSARCCVEALVARRPRAHRIPTPELNRFLGDVVGGAPAAAEAGTAAEAALHGADRDPPAALLDPGQPPQPTDARLRVLRREPAARALRAGGHPAGHRLRRAHSAPPRGIECGARRRTIRRQDTMRTAHGDRSRCWPFRSGCSSPSSPSPSRRRARTRPGGRAATLVPADALAFAHARHRPRRDAAQRLPGSPRASRLRPRCATARCARSRRRPAHSTSSATCGPGSATRPRRAPRPRRRALRLAGHRERARRAAARGAAPARRRRAARHALRQDGRAPLRSAATPPRSCAATSWPGPSSPSSARSTRRTATRPAGEVRRLHAGARGRAAAGRALSSRRAGSRRCGAAASRARCRTLLASTRLQAARRVDRCRRPRRCASGRAASAAAPAATSSRLAARVPAGAIACSPGRRRRGGRRRWQRAAGARAGRLGRGRRSPTRRRSTSTATCSRCSRAASPHGSAAATPRP